LNARAILSHSVLLEINPAEALVPQVPELISMSKLFELEGADDVDDDDVVHEHLQYSPSMWHSDRRVHSLAVFGTLHRRRAAKRGDEDAGNSGEPVKNLISFLELSGTVGTRFAWGLA
jgi:hypothetical protein